MLKKIIDKVLCIVTIISPKLNTKILYKRRFGEKINLRNPKTFNEKISWLKLYEYPKKKIYSDCADKVAVREHIRKLGIEEILIPEIGIYNSASEIDFAALPNSFVLKWNFGWGYNIICRSKKDLDINKTISQLNKWEKSKFYLKSSELHYKNINKKIICEEYIGKNNLLPEDYKIYCFNGKAEYVMICSERESKHTKFCFFDRNWNLCRINKQSLSFPENYTVEKPPNMDKMFEYADILSQGFKFVRVDLYNVDGKIYFGELTFTPASGLDFGYTKEGDILLGSKMEIK